MKTHHTDRNQSMRRVMRKARQVAGDKQNWNDFALIVAGAMCPSRALIAGAVRVRCQRG